MVNKEFMVWFLKQKSLNVTNDLVKITFGVESDVMIESLAPYFVLASDQSIQLNDKYALGHITIKRNVAFVLMGDEKDIAIDLFDLNGAMENDIVLVYKKTSDPYVVLIVKSDLTKLIADVKKKKDNLIRFDSKDAKDKLVVVSDYPEYLVDGHVVLLRVTEVTKTKIITTFDAVIGHVNDPDMDIVKIIYDYEWPMTFSKELLNELHHIKIDTSYERKTRVDLTNELIVTIDGADAKDLDDAIGLVKLPNGGFKLGVHIADVSYFVKEGSLLDKEAYKRATSVYLADRVIPMIPHGLSNDLCSLNPDEEKYTLTCEIYLNEDIEVTDYKLYASIIKTTKRLTYSAVNELLKDNVTVGNKAIDDMLFSMNEISKKLKVIRTKRGAIDFESSELKFIMDLKGQVLSVEERKTDEAEQLIESFMILANEVVATHFYKHNLPGIYRVHEKPTAEKLETALETTKKLGFTSDKNAKSSAKVLQRLTKDSAGTNYQYVVHMTLLRSMQKAKYSPDPIGHFGLGSSYYSHFTSPIRRYPDLLLHRMIRDLVLDQSDEKVFIHNKKHFLDLLPSYSEHTSANERLAINMERDVVKLKSAQYMQQFIGASYEGLIIQMMASGFFVKLDMGIEGFINVRNVNTYLIYDEENLLFFTDRGKRYRLGDKITVKLISVDMNENRIDFTIDSTNKALAHTGDIKKKQHKFTQNKKSQTKNKNRSSFKKR